MIRVTTNGVLRSYRYNLSGSFKNLNSARDTVLSERNFNSYMEDPATASKAFQLRRSLARVESQYSVTQTMVNKYDTGWKALEGVQSLLKSYNQGDNATSWDTVLRGLNDPEGDARAALGKVLSEMADTVTQSMNSKYGDEFIFAGADGLNVPFELTKDGLLFRGVPVDAGNPAVLGGNTPVEVDQNGVPTTGGGYYLIDNPQMWISKAEYEEQTQPALLKNGGAPIQIDFSGTMDGAGARYILADKTTLIDPSEKDNYPDNLILKDASGNLQRVNSQGELDPAGSYYLYLGDATINTTDYPLQEPAVVKDASGNPCERNKDGKPTAAGADGYYILSDCVKTISKAEYEENVKSFEKLEYMCKDEAMYVDIGLGMQENAGNKLIASSAFNSALEGIKYLGYGVDDEGDPKNVVSLLREMGSMLLEFKDGEWKGSTEWKDFNRLANKFEDAMAELDTNFTELSASTTKLHNNEKLLEEDGYNLQTQIADLEDVDMAEAITSFLYAQYCYNASLKVGNSILSQSLMDYMD